MTRKVLRSLMIAFVAISFAVAHAPSAAADEKTNEATAVNTEDGSKVFRFALSIRDVANGVVDQTNTATAQASCSDCTTVAAAFQVILVSGDTDVVKPENRATAVNVECAECLTYAKATQIVVNIDGMELSKNGQRRLKDLERRMHEVELNADNMSDAELLAAVQEAQNEIVAIYNEELVPIGSESGSQNGVGNSTTSTSPTTSSSTTSTTVARSTTTSTTEATSPTTATTTP